MEQEIRPGLRAEKSAVVDQALATNRNGIVVLASPSMILLMEQAAAEAVAPYLPPDSTTVGAEVRIRHLAPTPLGHRVVAEAELVEVEGRKLVFRVSARDPFETIGEGEHVRYIVHLDRYRARVQRKLGFSQSGKRQ